MICRYEHINNCKIVNIEIVLPQLNFCKFNSLNASMNTKAQACIVELVNILWSYSENELYCLLLYNILSDSLYT